MQQIRFIQQDNKILVEPTASILVAILCSKCQSCEDTFRLLSNIKKQKNQINIYFIFVERDPIAQVHYASLHSKIIGFKNHQPVAELKKPHSSENIQQFWLELVNQKETLTTSQKPQTQTIQPKKAESVDTEYKMYHP